MMNESKYLWSADFPGHALFLASKAKKVFWTLLQHLCWFYTNKFHIINDVVKTFFLSYFKFSYSAVRSLGRGCFCGGRLFS